MNQRSSDRYVLVLTEEEREAIVAFVEYFAQPTAVKIKSAPSGDVSMLLDAATDGCEHICSDYSLAGKPELRDEYRHVAEFIARIREHWKP